MKQLVRQMRGILVLVVVAMGLIGCTSNRAPSNETTSKQEGETKRIISVAPSLTEMIYALGAGNQLVGRTDFCDYPETVKEVEPIGMITPLNIEKVISLEPDLVVTSTHIDSDNVAELEELGIEVMELQEESDMEGVYRILNTLGAKLDKQEEAQVLIDDMKAKIDLVQEKVASLEKPTVYYVIGYGEYGDFSAPRNSFIGDLIDLAGGNNIVPESSSWSYTLEALLEADPEMIIVGKGQKEGFITAPGYRELTAVKENQVYEIDNNLLDRQSNRNAEGVLALAQIMHPEAFEE